MKNKTTLIGGVLAAATLLLPGIASASFLLDTGIPDGSGGAPTLLSSSQWVAAEFAATAGETITSLSAYLTAASTTGVGDTFTFDLYNGTGFTSRSRVLLQSFTGTYTADGWTTASSVNWTVPTNGDYWLALQVGGTTQPTKGVDLPTEASLQSGTAAALAFAVLNSNTNKQFTTANAPSFGVEVTLAPVPLPAGVWLFASGLLGLGALIGLQHVRRSPHRADDHNHAPAISGIHAVA
jgi:hypothetical protein